MAGATLTQPAIEASLRAAADPVERRAGVRERIVRAGLDALLVMALPNIRYLSGFSGSAGLLIVRAAQPDVFLTDFRYQSQIADELDPEIEVRIEGESMLKTARELLIGDGASRVAFEREQLTYRSWSEWSQVEGPALVPVAEWVEEARAVKSPAEIAAIRGACRIADEAFAAILAEIHPGISERELAARLELSLVARGAEGASFESIVAFGERSALPHARPSSRELRRGDIVLLDFGAVAEGYVSDITRTVSCGEPAAEMREVYAIVREAQRAALQGIGAGMSGPDADGLARQVIEAAGYGVQFGHSLGHGIGLEVHEAPRLSRKSDDRLAPGMTVTIEPGIYLKGIGGVRIEDDALVTEAGLEALTASPKDDLIVL